MGIKRESKNNGKQWLLNKIGSSNLELILSFVIFISFLFFLFLIFPLNSTEKSTVGLDAAEQKIMNFTSNELVYFSVAINFTSDKSCFYFEPNMSLRNIIVRDESDELAEAKTESLNTIRININGVGKFYQIYSCDEFEENNFTGDCESLGKDDYNMGLVRKYSVLSFSKINILKQTYTDDYLNLLRNFSIPPRENFDFSIRETNGSVIIGAERKKPARASILSRDVPVQIAYPNGELKYGILNIEVW